MQFERIHNYLGKELTLTISLSNINADDSCNFSILATHKQSGFKYFDPGNKLPTNLENLESAIDIKINVIERKFEAYLVIKDVLISD